MTNTLEVLQQTLEQQFPNAVHNFLESFGVMEFETTQPQSLKVLTFLYDNENFQYRFLADLTAVHFPEKKGQELQVVYHLHQLEKKNTIRIKVNVPIEKSEVFSASALFAAANWMERETYDFFGVQFIGHPNLKRILNVDEMDYFPLRKEYGLEDNTRLDKDDEMFGRGASTLLKE